MLNALTVDVEDYFHAANLSAVAGKDTWRKLPSRVVESTELVLDILERHNVKATFFVLAYSARRNPQLVKKITAGGHELASHGYGHRIAYEQTPKQFRRDVTLAKNILEQQSGIEVFGYRAPNFSITSKNPWAYKILAEAGFRYDSSRYPIWHPRYANRNQSLNPEKIETESGNLVCFPLAVASKSLFGNTLKFPVAGGAYWRLFPQRPVEAGLRSINRQNRWFTTYFHPWELDSGQPRFKLPYLTTLRHYGGVGKLATKIERFLEQFQFSSLIECAGAQLDSELLQILNGSESEKALSKRSN